jgi:hypothetical protein
MANQKNSVDGGVIFTFFKVGNSMKVTATDVGTGIEVVMQTPLSLSTEAMKVVSMQKLNYVMNKNRLANKTTT